MGTLGTLGTPATTRVSVSPRTQSEVRTTGDNGDKSTPMCDLLVQVHAICPHLSPLVPRGWMPKNLMLAQCPHCPQCPHRTRAGFDDAPMCADLAGDPTGAGVNICFGCLHLLPRRSRGESQSAGLLAYVQGVGIAWLAYGQGEACHPAFIGTVRPSACNRSAKSSMCLGLRFAAAMCR